MNNDLRLKIVKMICSSGEGHIPSSFSIVDIINFLYQKILRHNSKKKNWTDRDYFILSKGHGAAALYVVLNKFGFLTDKQLNNYGKSNSILGGHPDMTKVPGVEASTGSLGHGFPTAVGVALGLKIKQKKNRVFTLLGDGECHEGTIWESANIATNQSLGNICAIIDYNFSAKQLMPIDDIFSKWKSFGWEVIKCDGHNAKSLDTAFKKLKLNLNGQPKVIIAKTTKGKGVRFMQGHGKWHHKIPNNDELNLIIKELS